MLEMWALKKHAQNKLINSSSPLFLPQCQLTYQPQPPDNFKRTRQEQRRGGQRIHIKSRWPFIKVSCSQHTQRKKMKNGKCCVIRCSGSYEIIVFVFRNFSSLLLLGIKIKWILF